MTNTVDLPIGAILAYRKAAISAKATVAKSNKSWKKEVDLPQPSAKRVKLNGQSGQNTMEGMEVIST